MHTPLYTRQFDRDVRRMQRRGKNLEKLKIIIRTLVEEEPLQGSALVSPVKFLRASLLT